MDHSRAPVLDAWAEYRQLGRYGFTPSRHRQGAGADPRVREVLGGALAADILAARSRRPALARRLSGIPVIVPGELVDAAVVDYLGSGVEKGECAGSGRSELAHAAGGDRVTVEGR
ncbi:hypothetical protein [Nocardia sp. AB354]|uniref:hypothetical protein n=1 Tax=Nocardia sp. AB354 TaxID=3413283 RepID=UPI003C197B20